MKELVAHEGRGDVHPHRHGAPEPPVTGRITAGVFLGWGSMRYVPAQRAVLNHYYDVLALDDK